MKKHVLLPVIISCLISSLVFYGLYITDNKYTFPSPIAEQGVLNLENGGKELMYLTDGWEFYQYQFLSPSDWNGDNTPTPTAYTFIGEYLGFDMDDLSASPYGSATYRLTIFTGLDTTQSYTLELPEIFSAYSLWINGELLAGNGNPDPSSYRPELSHGSITFSAAECIELILAVTNYSHYYSGLIYPPAFGQIKAVNRTVNSAILISAISIIFAVAIGIFYLLIGRFTRDKKTALVFGILCLIYAGSVSHQLVHFISAGYFKVWYAVEDFSLYALLSGFVFISALLFRPGSRLARIIPIAGMVTGLSAVLTPLVLSSGSAVWAVCLSLLIKAYKLTVICALFFILVKAKKQGEKHAALLLSAVSAFTVSLLADTFIAFYEPIRFGWPTEIGGFIMVCALGIIITLDAVDSLRERVRLSVLNEQMGLSYNLLMQKIEQAKQNSHDLRHHMAVLGDFSKSGDTGRIDAYISAYMNQLPTSDGLHFCRIPAVDAVVRYYYMLAKNEDVDISVNIELPETQIPEQDLSILFGNLLENAIEACRLTESDKVIRFTVQTAGGFITVISDNSFDGNLKTENARLRSRKHTGFGVGTASIKAIAEKHGGYAEFTAKQNIFEASVVLHLL